MFIQFRPRARRIERKARAGEPRRSRDASGRAAVPDASRAVSVSGRSLSLQLPLSQTHCDVDAGPSSSRWARRGADAARRTPVARIASFVRLHLRLEPWFPFGSSVLLFVDGSATLRCVSPLASAARLLSGAGWRRREIRRIYYSQGDINFSYRMEKGEWKSSSDRQTFPRGLQI